MLEHDDDGDGTWTPIVLSDGNVQLGSYGGLTGFSLPPGEEREIPFRLSAPSGTFHRNLTVEVRLNTVHPTTGAVVTTLGTAEGQVAFVTADREPTTVTISAVGVHGSANTIRTGDALGGLRGYQRPSPGRPPAPLSRRDRPVLHRRNPRRTQPVGHPGEPGAGPGPRDSTARPRA